MNYDRLRVPNSFLYPCVEYTTEFGRTGDNKPRNYRTLNGESCKLQLVIVASDWSVASSIGDNSLGFQRVCIVFSPHHPVGLVERSPVWQGSSSRLVCWKYGYLVYQTKLRRRDSRCHGLRKELRFEFLSAHPELTTSTTSQGEAEATSGRIHKVAALFRIMPPDKRPILQRSKHGNEALRTKFIRVVLLCGRSIARWIPDSDGDRGQMEGR